MRLALPAATAALATLVAPLLTTAPAQAGGVGVLAAGGMYSERVWYYDTNEVGYQTRQAIPLVGSGLDFVLGDRDDRIVGVARFYWELSAPEPDLSGSTLEGPAPHSFPRREDPYHAGVFAVGLQAGILGDPEEGMLTLNANVGTGFLTTDHREYLFAELGAGGTYRLSRTLEAYGNLNAHFRYRKWAKPGGTAYAGVRVLFD